MTGTRSMHQRKIDRLKDAHESGELQKLADQGMTLIQIASKYNVAESTVRRLGANNGTKLKFKGKCNLKNDVESRENWSDAKRLAMGAW